MLARSQLLLARFAKPELVWEYATPLRAKCRVKFIEVPDEYVTPNPNLPEPAYLYKFTTLLPEPQIQYFTSYEDSLYWDGSTWTPAPFSHDVIKSGIKFEREECEITSWGGDFPGNPLGGLFPYTLEGPLFLDIVEINAISPGEGSIIGGQIPITEIPDPGYARILFSGIVTKPDMTGKDWKATARWFGNFFDRNVPRFYFQKTCNVAVYSAKCGVNRADFQVIGTFLGAPGTQTVVPITGGTDKAANYFAEGFCETGSGANFERRAILYSQVVSGHLEITIDKHFRYAISSQTVYLFPGCNLSLDMCIGRFNNQINMRGHPFIPINNPSANIGVVANVTGGKKG